MAEQQIAANATIFNEGDPADKAYVVLQGTIEVFKNDAGKEVKIAEFNEGEMFGETGIFDANAPHPNSARAKTDASVDGISFEELSDMVKAAPPRLIPIISSVFERLAALNQRPQQKAQIEAVLDVDADKITVSGGNETTKELFQPKDMAVVHLPMRIGGYQKDSEPDRNHGNHVIMACEGPPLVVSAHHCEVIADEGKLYVRDLGSRFGTTINDVTVGRGKGEYKVPLQKGDNTVILGEKKTSPYHITVTVA